MKQVEVKYAPGMRIIVRGEEWLVKKVETNSLENQTLHVIGLSQLVKDYESMFLVDIEDDIEIVDPAKVMEDWTWEACVYNCNKEKLDTMIQVQDGAEYLFHRTNYGQVLGKMLNNKVDTAYQMLISEEDFVIPGYVEEAIEWLNE